MDRRFKALVLLLCLTVAHAQVVIPGAIMRTIATAGGGGCTTPTTDTFTGTTAGPDTDSATILVSRFVASDTYTMCKVTIRLARVGTLDGTWQARLYSHNAGANSPDTLIDASDSDPAITASPTFSDVTFTGLAGSIASGTTYWIGIFHSTGGDFSGVMIDTQLSTVTSGRLMYWDGDTWEESDTGSGLSFTAYE